MHGAGMGPLDGRGGAGGDRRPVPGKKLLLPERRAKVHPNWSAMRPGRPGRPAGDVVRRNDARKRHGLPLEPVQPGVLRQEQGAGHLQLAHRPASIPRA
jgi:hypothetical protein